MNALSFTHFSLEFEVKDEDGVLDGEREGSNDEGLDESDNEGFDEGVWVGIGVGDLLQTPQLSIQADKIFPWQYFFFLVSLFCLLSHLHF